MERKSMGSFMAALRKARGFTQKELAEKLNVSDKSVSRWERDEGTPDLSLIPVIAEIFGVTSDELLRGERISTARTDALEDSHDAKTEKQRHRLLAVQLFRYKSKSAIAAGIAVCGLIAALIANFAFLRAYIGFFVGLVFFLAAGIAQFIYINSAFLAVSGSECSDVEIGDFKCFVVLLAEKVFGLTVVLFGSTIPLVAFVRDAYVGLSADYFLGYALLFGGFAAFLCCAVCYGLNGFWINSGTVVLDKKRAAVYYHNHKLKFRFCLVLLTALITTALVGGALTAWGDSAVLADGTVFADFEEFKAYMELDISNGNNLSGPAVPVPDGTITYFDEAGNIVTEQEAMTRTITDADGNVVGSFIHRNQRVSSWRHGSSGLPITVFTLDDMQQARKTANKINWICWVLCLLEAIAVLFVYSRKRMRCAR